MVVQGVVIVGSQIAEGQTHAANSDFRYWLGSSSFVGLRGIRLKRLSGGVQARGLRRPNRQQYGQSDTALQRLDAT